MAQSNTFLDSDVQMSFKTGFSIIWLEPQSWTVRALCLPSVCVQYVGESERAVRQVFQRAKNSAPCVIFFDEVDALCPRRSDREVAVIEGLLQISVLAPHAF